MKTSRPSTALSCAIVLLAVAIWTYLRMFLFSDVVMPITFVLPLLLCVWTQRRWQLWLMASFFAVKTIVKVFWWAPMVANSDRADFVYLGSTLFNIVMGALVIHVLIVQRENRDRQSARISEQNATLEAQAEELYRQNEEIKAQAEELAEQNEEMEAQSEEVARQNEDLVELNNRLSGREEILEGLMHSIRARQSVDEMLRELCRRALSVIGAPASAVGILEASDDSSFVLRSSASIGQIPPVPEQWPLESSLAGLVLKENKTAYVSDLEQRADLSAPYGNGDPVRSLLATPLPRSHGSGAVLVACSLETSHWTEDQFKIVEWVAAQAGLIMEVMRAQGALEEHASALEAANQAKDRFLATLSHELRTPLTPALAAAGALEQDDRLPGDVREDASMIRRNIGIQSRLIDDLLDLTRISRGKIELDREVLPVAELLKDSARIVAGELDARSQSIEVNVDGLNGSAIVGDSSRLQQVFWNLIKNASKFSDPGATIRVHGRTRGDRIRIDVVDPGAGLSAEDLTRIFLPFEQIQNELKRTGEGGLGLGLAIAHSIVDLHGGTIVAKSQGRGHGSTFTVELPAVELPSARAPLPSAPASSQRSANSERRLLLVEDHGDTRRVLERLLQSIGFSVDAAEDAACAWKLFQSHTYDAVISDVGLPDESGIDLMRRMRAARPETRGICLSGYGMEEDIVACREAGFREHLTKPIDFSRLQVALSKVLD